MRKITITSLDSKNKNEDTGEHNLVQTVELSEYTGEGHLADLFHDLTSCLGAMLTEHMPPDKARECVNRLIVRQLLGMIDKSETGDVITHSGMNNIPIELQLASSLAALRSGGKGGH